MPLFHGNLILPGTSPGYLTSPENLVKMAQQVLLSGIGEGKKEREKKKDEGKERGGIWKEKYLL